MWLAILLAALAGPHASAEEVLPRQSGPGMGGVAPGVDSAGRGSPPPGGLFHANEIGSSAYLGWLPIASAPPPRPGTWAYLNPMLLYASPQEAPPLPTRASGRLVNRYRLQQVELDGDETGGREGSRLDQDVWSYLSMKTTDVGVDGLSARFAARYTPDIDGHHDSGVWTDTIDTNGPTETFRPYQLWVMYDDALPGLSVKAGRQAIHVVDWARFDGGRIDYRPIPAVHFTGFVGRRVFFHHEAPDRVVFGGALSLRPLPRTAIHVRDLAYTWNAFEVEVSQGLHRHVDVSAAYGWIQGKGNEFRSYLDGFIPPSGTRVRVGYLRNLGRSENELVLDYTMVGDPEKDGIDWLKLRGREPYHDYLLEIQQRLHRNVEVTGSYLLRDTSASNAAERTWNQDFQLATAGVQLRNLPVESLALGATYRYWTRIGAVKAGEEVSHEVLGEAAYRIGPASFGGGIVFRTFDAKTPFTEVENRDSIGWRAYLAWDFTRHVTARLEYLEDRDYEDLFPDIDLVRGVVAQLTVKF